MVWYLGNASSYVQWRLWSIIIKPIGLYLCSDVWTHSVLFIPKPFGSVKVVIDYYKAHRLIFVFCCMNPFCFIHTKARRLREGWELTIIKPIGLYLWLCWLKPFCFIHTKARRLREGCELTIIKPIGLYLCLCWLKPFCFIHIKASRLMEGCDWLL